MREKERPAPPRPRDRRLLAEMRPPPEHAGQRPAPAITHPPMQTVDAAPAGAKLTMLQREIHKRMIIPQIPKRNHPLGGNAPPGKESRKRKEDGPKEGGRGKPCAPRVPPRVSHRPRHGKARKARPPDAGQKKKPANGKRARRRATKDGGVVSGNRPMEIRRAAGRRAAEGKRPGGNRAGRRVNDGGKRRKGAPGEEGTPRTGFVSPSKRATGRRARQRGKGKRTRGGPCTHRRGWAGSARREAPRPMPAHKQDNAFPTRGAKPAPPYACAKKGPSRGPSHRRRTPQRMRRRKATPATPSASNAKAVGSGAAL